MRATNEVDGSISIGSGVLAWTAQATPVFGDLVFRDANDKARVPGRAFAWSTSVAGVAGNTLVGVSNNVAPGAATVWGILFTLAFCYVRLLATSVTNAIPNFAAVTWYRWCVVMRSAGFFVFQETALPKIFNLHWVDNAINSVSNYLCFEPYDTAGNADNLRIRDLHWSDYQLAQAYIALPNSGNTMAGVADGLTEFTWTPAAAETFELSVRMTDANNRWIIRCDQAAGTIKIIERNASIETERASVAQVFNVGTAYRIVVKCVTQSIKTWVNNVYAANFAVAAFNQTETGAMCSGFASGQTFVAWPYTVRVDV